MLFTDLVGSTGLAAAASPVAADKLRRKHGEMRFSDAQTNLLWGRALRARRAVGDIDRARELLQEAASSAASGRYAKVERRARAEVSKLTEAYGR